MTLKLFTARYNVDIMILRKNRQWLVSPQSAHSSLFMLCRTASVARISTRRFYESDFRQLRGRRQGQADAYPLWLQKSQFRHHFISSYNADAARWI